MEKFNLEYQWSLYLEKAGLKLDRMHPVQIVETKRAFVAGLGQMFILFNGYEDEDTMVDAIGQLHDQIITYWSNQIA